MLFLVIVVSFEIIVRLVILIILVVVLGVGDFLSERFEPFL
jgi:hypothetical protein